MSRIYGKDLGQDGGVMGTLRFAHPTGLTKKSTTVARCIATVPVPPGRRRDGFYPDRWR